MELLALLEGSIETTALRQLSTHYPQQKVTHAIAIL